MKYNKFKQGESYRHTRVKMHKSGKHWVRTIMSKVGTIRFGIGLTKSSEQKIKMVDPNDLRKTLISPQTVLKGAGAIGAILGGAALGTDEAFAEETVIASETSSTQSVIAEEVTIQVSETAVSEEPKSNIVDLIRASEKSEAEASISASVSVSQSVEASISDSILQSLSESQSVSISESVSASESLSVSESLANSEQVSESSSLVKKDSQSETSSSSSTSEKTAAEKAETIVDETAVEESLEKLNRVTSGAEILTKIATEQDFDLTKPDLAKALAASQADVVTATTLLGDKSASLVDIQTAITSVQNSSQALVTELLKQRPDGKLSYKMDTHQGDTIRNIGEVGLGTLIDTSVTASPSMDDPFGAKMSEKTVPSGRTATSQPGWHTYQWLRPTQYTNTMSTGGRTGLPNTYLRYSLNSDPRTADVLVELVDLRAPLKTPIFTQKIKKRQESLSS